MPRWPLRRRRLPPPATDRTYGVPQQPPEHAGPDERPPVLPPGVGADPVDPRELIGLVEVGAPWQDGFDFTVELADEVWLYLDDERDDVEQRLAAADGVRQAQREDREVIHVRVVGLDADALRALTVDAILAAIGSR